MIFFNMEDVRGNYDDQRIGCGSTDEVGKHGRHSAIFKNEETD
jgi:hypothetical protein